MPNYKRTKQSAVICILNDAAGRDSKEPTNESIVQMFVARNTPASVWVAHSGDELAELARRAVSLNPSILVAGGGDGTINCVAAALAGADIILGVLPMGTLNHFAKDLGIPLAIEEAIDTIVHGKATRVDVGEVNDRIFLNNSSLGLYPRLVRERERLQGGGSRKAIAFVRAFGAVLFRYSLIHVRLETAGNGTGNRRTPFVFVGNNEYRAEGWNFGTRERLDAGRLWIYMAPYRGPLGWIALTIRALFGRSDDKAVESFETSECWIETKRKHVDVALDGEVTRMISPLHYRIRPGALVVMTPGMKPASK